MCADGDRLLARAAVHAALSDPRRLAIVDELLCSDRSPSELSDILAMESNLLAHHLDVLARAGLVERLVSSGDRRRRYVRLRHGALEAVEHVQRFAAREVVFVCSQNSARSQLAAAIWNNPPPHGPRRAVAATSAGMHPAHRVHPGALAVAARHGLSLESAVPRHLGRLSARQLVVTVCDRAQEELPAPQRVRALHWSIDDPVPAGTPAAFEQAYQAIEARVHLLALLVHGA